MYCKKCGKEVSYNSSFCQNCGEPIGERMEPNIVTYDKSKYNTICIVGLVISSISLFLDFVGIMGIIGTVVSVVGLLKAKENNEKGKILAIVGIILGIIEMFYSLVIILSLQNYFLD